MKGKKFSAILCFVLALMYVQCAFADSSTIKITTASLPPALTGQNYSQTLSADSSPTSWAVSSGDLPAGLALNEAGLISGIVSADAVEHNAPEPKSYVFTVTASNTSGDSSAKTLLIDVYEPITITTVSLPNAKVGVSYEAQIEASGTSASDWTLRPSTDVPKWLTLSNSENINVCKLSGLPDEAGVFTFRAECGNLYFNDGKIFTLTVDPEDDPVVIASENLSPARIGQVYSHDFKASGDPISWRITSGDLPSGLTFSSDGAITGTVSMDAIETNAGAGKVYSFNVTAANATKSDTKTFSITVYQPVRIITESLPNARAGEEYQAEIEAEGTREAFSQNITTLDNIPQGLQYNMSVSGKITISGTPSVAGTYSIGAVFANRWTTDERSFTLTVEERPALTAKPKISIPKTDGKLIVGKNCSFPFVASSNQPVNWGITGNVPAGLTFDTSTGKLSGTAQAIDAGKNSYSPMTYNFTVTATNSGGTDSADMYMRVYYPPEIVTSTLPDASQNTGYMTEIIAEGTEQGMTWKTSSVKLPQGLELKYSGNNRKCTLIGTPREVGQFSFTLKASNTAGDTSQKTFILSVIASSIGTGKPSVTTMSLADGETGKQYVALLEASGKKPITWSKSKSFPKILTLDARSGIISGVPTKPGKYNFTMTATNSEGSSSQNLTIVITGENYKKPTISTKKLPAATHNQPYSAQLTCKGAGPITWSFANNKQPSGIYITEDGKIAGLPKEAGTFKIKVKAENNKGSATRTLSLKVNGVVPEILNNELPSGTKKVSYNAQLIADGTETIKWSKSGSFPSGLKLNKKTGAITGKPKKANTYNFRITAKNKYGRAPKSFIIIVTEEAQETSSTASTTPEPSTAVAQSYSQEYSEPETLNPPVHESEIDLCVVSGDEELRGEIYAPEGKPLTFRIGAEAEDVEVYIADEAIELDVEDDGAFVLPGELVSDEFVIYAVSDGVKTTELYIVAEEEE